MKKEASMDDDLRRLRNLVVDGAPSEEATERMRASLMGHIANTQLRDEIAATVDVPELDEVASARMRRTLMNHVAPKPKRTSKRRVVAAVIAVAAAATVFALIPLGGNDTGAVALLNIAEAVMTVPDTDFSDAAVERRSDQLLLVIESVDGEEVAFHRPATEVWRMAPDGVFQVEYTVDDLRFFTPVDQDTLETLNEVHAVGRTETATYPPSDDPQEPSMLTDDAGVLSERIYRDIERFGPPEVPVNVQVLRRVASIYSEELPTNSERAALLTVVSDTRDVTYAADDTTGTVTASIRYTRSDGTPVEYALVFDSDGWLIRETETLLDGIPEMNVPAGTPELDVIYQLPVTSP